MPKITKKVTPRKTATKKGGKKIQKPTKLNVAKTPKKLASSQKAKALISCNICGAEFAHRSGKSRHVQQQHPTVVRKNGRPSTGGRKPRKVTPKAKPEVLRYVKNVRPIYKDVQAERPYYYTDYHGYDAEECDPRVWGTKYPETIESITFEVVTIQDVPTGNVKKIYNQVVDINSKLGQLLLSFAGTNKQIPYPDVSPEIVPSPIVKEPEEEGQGEDEQEEIVDGAEQPITLTDNKEMCKDKISEQDVCSQKNEEIRSNTSLEIDFENSVEAVLASLEVPAEKTVDFVPVDVAKFLKQDEDNRNSQEKQGNASQDSETRALKKAEQRRLDEQMLFGASRAQGQLTK